MKHRKLIILTLFLSCICLTSLRASTAKEPGLAPQIEDIGTFIDLPDGNRMQFVAEDLKVVARYVSPSREQVENEVESIVFEIDDPGHRHDEWRTLLQPLEGEEAAFSSPRLLQGPYLFRTRVVITFTSGEPWTFTNLQLDLKRNIP